VTGDPAAGGGSESEYEASNNQARLATVCAALLRRYGVVFRTVLERESLAPPWRHLLRYLRRMEDRGEVHGGRFVDGFSGEQFALPEAVGLLRRHAAEPSEDRFTVINAGDPLNLGGIVTPGVKTPAKAGNRVLLLNGVPAARLLGDDLELIGRTERVGSSEAERYLRVVRSLPRSLVR
jgi:ATP-dependent Lhr-like helicase